MGTLPQMPPEVQNALPPVFRTWWESFRTFINKDLTTIRDVTISTAGKGVVVTNAAGTITKRIRLNAAGTDIEIEDV